MIQPSDLRILIIGAHPDDPDLTGGGLALKYVKAGATVKFVSLSNGDRGHHRMTSEALAARRLIETQQVKEVLGIAEYQVFSENHDCELTASIALRQVVTRLVRTFNPHLIFTHRTCDYHADHRAVGTLVMDAAYLLGVPLWCPETPIASNTPAIYFLRDGFTSPSPLRPDIVVGVDSEMDQLLEALCCHTSQFFEWLYFDLRLTEPIPADLEGRKAFIEKHWVTPRKVFDAQRFREQLIAAYGAERGAAVQHAEAYECSEYGLQPTPEEAAWLFPFFA